MATIVFTLSTKVDKTDGNQEVMMRLYQGRINQRGGTGIFGPAKYWDPVRQRFTTPPSRKRILPQDEQDVFDMVSRLNAELAEVERYVLERFREAGSGRAGLPVKWLPKCLDGRYAERVDSADGGEAQDFVVAFHKYLEHKNISDSRINHFRVNLRELERFAVYRGMKLSFAEIDEDFLHDFSDFLDREHTFYHLDDGGRMVFDDAHYESAFASVPESRPPKERSKNTIVGKMTRLHSFFLWAKDQGYITEDPFAHVKVGAAMYGDPIYLSAAERDALYHADLSDDPSLAVQRDVFVLQCFIGCRVSEYYRMTKDNYIDGAIHYIPDKTGRGELLVVYLMNDIPKEILRRYSDVSDGMLMPFISQQKYNSAIKRMIRRAGIDRQVIVLDPKTRQERRCLLSDVASSHMARRTFVGQLYKMTKDPAQVGKVSGHAPNSRAFLRYRKIDEDDSRELLSKL